jgi:transcriptional regulator with XRE-family HTH domain
MLNNIGLKIKAVRQKKNLSQERFGAKIGLSGKSISCYERGVITPPLKVLENISQVYNVSLVVQKKERKDELNERLNLVRRTIEEISDALGY